MGTIDFDDTLIATREDLFAIATYLADRGWVGSVGLGGDVLKPTEPPAWSLDFWTPGNNGAVDGTLGTDGHRHVTAAIGDWKVVMGSTMVTVTPEIHAATYGSA